MSNTIKSSSVLELVDRIANNDYVIPEIQREFVWDLQKIVNLWDSIYSGYPIGQFLFWINRKTSIPTYPFLVKDYEYLFCARRPQWKHSISKPNSGKTMVLDGQQRLTSLFLGLSEKGILLKTRANSPQETQVVLCIYLGEEDETLEEQPDRFRWAQKDQFDDYVPVHEVMKGKRQHPAVRRLKQAVRSKTIAVETIHSDAAEAVEIFSRLNNAGTPLRKSEVFLALWFGSDTAKNFRNDLIEIRDLFGEFQVHDDTIVRILTMVFGDTKSITKNEFSQSSGNPGEMADSIRRGMKKLKRSITCTVKFLNDYCNIYSDDEMISHNVFLPLVLLFYEKGSNPSELLKRQMRCFVYRALIFGLFDRHTTRTLIQLRNSVRATTDDWFSELKENSIRNTLLWDYSGEPHALDNRIHELFELEKGRRTMLILLLLKQEKANTSRDNTYHQDHLFARDLFDECSDVIEGTMRKKHGIELGIASDFFTDDERQKWNNNRKRWAQQRDQLPNLWLLESGRNKSKGKILLNIWYGRHLDKTEQRAFRKETLLAQFDEDFLGIANFENVFRTRSDALERKLKDLLALPKPS